MHVLTPDMANGEVADFDKVPQAPEHLMLARLDEPKLAEFIEQHIDYVTMEDRSVHLPSTFVKHYLERHDDVLPIASAISTLPLVLPYSGDILSANGLDRQRGIIFRVPPHILNLVPNLSEITPIRVAKAMAFLTDEWMADIATTYGGKCVLIAAALTIIERSLLDNRPAFFVTAGRRGGGKTTALSMLMMAVTGVQPAAAAWSDSAEERRKALMAYLNGALPAIIWDNIPRGTQISCPHIEKACTAAVYSDRILGNTEFVTVSAATVHLFTGNNIGPKGDLSSRSLDSRLEIDRHDPENRQFRHTDPIRWTEANRGNILRALYVVMLGNPSIRLSANAEIPTRFKMWWRIVGSAVENAVGQHLGAVENGLITPDERVKPSPVCFKELFLDQEVDDEESASLGDALDALEVQWQKAREFKSKDVAELLNKTAGEQQLASEKERIVVMREFLFPEHHSKQEVSAKSVGKALNRHTGEPVRFGGDTLTLLSSMDSHTKQKTYHVKRAPS